LQVRFFEPDLDLDLRTVDLDLDLALLKRTWTRTWTCPLNVDLNLDLKTVDLDLHLDLAVAGLVTSLGLPIQDNKIHAVDMYIQDTGTHRLQYCRHISAY